MTIDMHAHWSPPELIEMYRSRSHPPMVQIGQDGTEVIKTRRGEETFDNMFDNLEKRLGEMDKYQVDVGVLSLWGVHQWIERLPIEESLPLVRAYNDSVSGLCINQPDRFLAYASLPLADLEAAVEEFERALRLTGIIGAIVPGNAFMTYQDLDTFRPILEAAHRNKAVLFIHKDYDFSGRQWLIDIFGQEELSIHDRRAILAGRPLGKVEDKGAIVCSCFQVGENTIQKANRI